MIVRISQRDRKQLFVLEKVSGYIGHEESVEFLAGHGILGGYILIIQRGHRVKKLFDHCIHVGMLPTIFSLKFSLMPVGLV